MSTATMSRPLEKVKDRLTFPEVSMQTGIGLDRLRRKAKLLADAGLLEMAGPFRVVKIKDLAKVKQLLS